MFIGKLDAWATERKFLPVIFEKAIGYLASVNAEKITVGVHYIEGESIFAKVETGHGKEINNRKFELHQQFIDIQMLLSGNERQDFVIDMQHIELLEDRLAADDIAFYKVTDSIQSLYLHPGMFIVYFPGELHAPGLWDGCGDFKKIVIKLNSSLI
jgi:biofilm protein TabA